MSHVSGAIKFKDETVMFYEYDGTSDICISHLYKTMKEVVGNWRKSAWLKCICGSEEDVEIYSSYGYGKLFKGKACKKCLSLTHEIDFETIWRGKTEKDIPNWVRQALDKERSQRTGGRIR